MKDFSPVSTLLRQHLQRSEDPPEEAPVQRELLTLWNRYAGKSAEFSYPILFCSGRLVVFTESPVWATEIRHIKTQIEQGLSSLGISNIEIRTSPKVFLPKPKPKRAVELSQRNRSAMKANARQLDHQGLKQALIKLSKNGTDEKAEQDAQ